jgi:hypothetical protein
MGNDLQLQPALQRAIGHLLRPLFRVLLRHSVSFRAFEDVAKRAYVEVALNDFSLPGKKPTASRVAVLSGLTRKEVQTLLAEQGEEDAQQADVSDRYNRAARVLTGWLRDPNFHGADKQPRLLEVDGEHGFGTLVKRYSGDMPTRAVLDELIRVGAVSRRDDGRLELLTPGYVPSSSTLDKIGILGSDVAALIDTIDHNLESGHADPRFQRKVMYDAIPVSALPAFRKMSAEHAQALLVKLDRWLAEHDLDQTPKDTTTPRTTVGVGIYYFEDRLAPRTASIPAGDTP